MKNQAQIQYPERIVNALRFVINKALGRRKYITKYELQQIVKKIRENQEFQFVSASYLEKFIQNFVEIARFDTKEEHILFLMGLYANRKTILEEIYNEIIAEYPEYNTERLKIQFDKLKKNLISDITFFLPNSVDNLLKFLQNES